MTRAKSIHKQIIVTGGAGFIGSHLCMRLLNDGHRVICLDNLSTGSRQNIKSLEKNPYFSFINHDITIPFPATDISMIFNLACPASPIQYQKDAICTTKAAVLGTLNMLELARRNDCLLLQASTSEVYGDPLAHPQTEDYWGNVNPIGPRSCYDEGKRCAESLCMDFHRQYGTMIKIVRIFNTYGPRMAINDGRVIPNFIIQALNGKEITIYGNGTQTRSFLYIDDLIEAIIRITNTNANLTGPINIGNPHECAIMDLAYKILDLTKSSSNITKGSFPIDDPLRRCPDITYATKILDGWSPLVTLEQGLKKTIEYFKQECSETKS